MDPWSACHAVWPREKKKSCREGLRETGRKEYLETACWETVLHGSLTFLPVVQAKELTPLTHTPPDNLFKDVCKRTTLEEWRSMSLWSRGQVYSLCSTIEIMLGKGCSSLIIDSGLLSSGSLRCDGTPCLCSVCLDHCTAAPQGLWGHKWPEHKACAAWCAVRNSPPSLT